MTSTQTTKGRIDMKTSDGYFLAWNAKYGAVVNSDESICCKSCGRTLIGIGPTVKIECLDCFKEIYENSQKAMDSLAKLDEELGLN